MHLHMISSMNTVYWILSNLNETKQVDSKIRNLSTKVSVLPLGTLALKE